MRLAGLNPTSLFDGVGINFVVFFQGCKHHCPRCQNPSTWDFNGGVEMYHEELQSRISKYLPFITGITLSGGDPVYQLEDALMLAWWAKSKGLTVTLYTGFTLDALQNIVGDNVDMPFDYIIDGRFDNQQRMRDCAFRGSVNQTVWKKSADGLYENVSDFLDRSARR